MFDVCIADTEEWQVKDSTHSLSILRLWSHSNCTTVRKTFLIDKFFQLSPAKKSLFSQGFQKEFIILIMVTLPGPISRQNAINDFFNAWVLLQCVAEVVGQNVGLLSQLDALEQEEFSRKFEKTWDYFSWFAWKLQLCLGFSLYPMQPLHCYYGATYITRYVGYADHPTSCRNVWKFHHSTLQKVPFLPTLWTHFVPSRLVSLRIRVSFLKKIRVSFHWSLNHDYGRKMQKG